MRTKTGWLEGVIAPQPPQIPDLSSGFATVLREGAPAAWDAVIDHPFLDQLIAGRLSSEAFHHYLTQEYILMDNMIALTGAAIATAPSLADRVTLVRYMDSISAHENSYYRRAFVLLAKDGCTGRLAGKQSVFKKFREFIGDITAGGVYAEKLAVLYGVAGSKLAGAGRAEERRPKLPHYAEWIDLHVNRMFREAVQNVSYQFEHEETANTPKARLVGIFSETLGGIREMFDSALALDDKKESGISP